MLDVIVLDITMLDISMVLLYYSQSFSLWK